MQPRLRRRAALALGAVLFLPGRAGARGAPCCGPVTSNGMLLARFLDRTGVEQLWRSGWHVDWLSGRTNRPEPGGAEAKTHCSAFVASVAARLGAYVPRPPAHRQELLANAQMAWLEARGATEGWHGAADEAAAQGLANRGLLALASWRNPNPHRPGHIAVVRPSAKAATELASDGPQITRSGSRNYLSTTLRTGFGRRRPDVRFFARDIAGDPPPLRNPPPAPPPAAPSAPAPAAA